MTALSRLALRHPFLTLALAAALVLAAAPGLPRLALRTDGQALVPQGVPEVRYDREIREQFGLRDPIAVVVGSPHPAGIWNPRTLRLVRGLTADLARLPGVDAAHLQSLATEHTFRFQPGTLDLQTFLETPATPAGLARLRGDLAAIGLHDGLLVARDGRAAAILLGVPPGVDRAAFYRALRGAVAGRDRGPDTVEVIGAPVAETLLGDHILADLGLPAGWLGEPPDALGALDAPDRTAAGGGRGLAGELTALGRRVGLVPLALGVMALVFFAGFSRPGAALLSLVKLGSCLAILLGAMGWIGVPVYLTVAMMPVILIAVGVADEVHLLRRYRGLRGERPGAGAAELSLATIEEMASPVMQTSLTTVVGFLSFSLSPIVPVRVFGLWTALGVAVCLLWSLTVTPALLALLPPGVWVSRPRGGAPAAGRSPGGWFAQLGGAASRHRGLLLVAAGVAALVAADGVRRLEVQDSWIDGFDRQTPFYRAMRRFEEQFRGVHLLQVVVEAEPAAFAGQVAGGAVDHDRLLLPLRPTAAPPVRAVAPARLAGAWIRLVRPAALPGEASPREWRSWIATARPAAGGLAVGLPPLSGSPRFWLHAEEAPSLGYEVRLEPFMVPATLARVEGLERFLAGRPGVGGVLGPARLVETLAFMLEPGRAGSRRIPESPGEVRTLWGQLERVEGSGRLRQRVDAGYARALVTVFLRRANYADFRHLTAELRAYERRHLTPHGLRLRLAGDATVSQALVAAVVRTQVGSLALSLAGILAVTALLGRSLAWGLCCVVPPAFAVLLNFAVMGWLGIPLGVATSMFAGMTLGVGVDYSIHLLARYRRLCGEGREPEPALAATLAAIGPAVLIDAASVGLGFSVLLLSRVPINARLGGLLVLCVANCFLATFLILPALLSLRGRRSGVVSSL